MYINCMTGLEHQWTTCPRVTWTVAVYIVVAICISHTPPYTCANTGCSDVDGDAHGYNLFAHNRNFFPKKFDLVQGAVHILRSSSFRM